MFQRKASDRLQRRVTTERRAFDNSVRTNDLIGALWHSEQEEKAVTELIEREPEVVFHRFVLAGLLYNRATVQDAIGQGVPAVATVRRSLEIYESFDPVRGAPTGVEQQLRALRSTFGTDAEFVIAHAADARARYARLLAKYEGRSVADAVHRHGAAAVKTYEALLQFGNETTQSDVDRIRTQYESAKEYLS